MCCTKRVQKCSQISINNTDKQERRVSHLCDFSGIFEIESLSMSLEVTLASLLARSKVLFVQLTGTKRAHERNAIGIKILSLHGYKENIIINIS